MDKKNTEKKKLTRDMKIFLSISTVVIVGLIIFIITLLAPKDEIMATFDGNSITSSEFQYYYQQNLSVIMQYKDPSMDDQTFLSSTYQSGSTATVKDLVKQQAMSQAVQTRYLLLKVKEDGFKADATKIDQAWQTFNTSLQQNATSSQMTESAFVKAAFGASMSRIESIYRDSQLAQQYYDSKAGQISVDAAKLTDYYNTNKKSIDRAVVRHILINCASTASDSVVAEKKKLAEDILARVNNGEDFAALAKQYSEDTGSKDSGGVYEIHDNGQMVAEFEQWAFTHKPGDTGIVRSTYGFHVMKLDSLYDTLDSQKASTTLLYQTDEYQKTVAAALTDSKYKISVTSAFSSF